MKHIDTHPKSSSSIEWYFSELWDFVKGYDYKLIGKPYGCHPMLKVWLKDESLKEYHTLIENYTRPGIEHEELPFIDYADFTLGNSLGIAEGIAICNPESKIFVIISDAQMNMGVVQEAISSIGSKCLKNILLVVDYNFAGSRGDLLVLPEIEYDGWCTSVIRDPQKLGHLDKNYPNLWVYCKDLRNGNK